MEKNQKVNETKTQGEAETEESFTDLLSNPIFLMCILLGVYFIFEIIDLVFGWSLAKFLFS